MTKITLYVGLFDKDTRAQRVSTLEAYKVIQNLLVHYVGGGTVSESFGVYSHSDGNTVVEPSLRIEYITDKDTRELVHTIKATLNQESVLVERSQVQSTFE